MNTLWTKPPNANEQEGPVDPEIKGSLFPPPVAHGWRNYGYSESMLSLLIQTLSRQTFYLIVLTYTEEIIYMTEIILLYLVACSLPISANLPFI